MAVCTKCGATVEPGAPNCPSCGAAIAPGTAVAAPKTSALAVSALIFGILGIICIVPIVGLVALILGISALVAIRRRPEVLTGSGMAIAGVVLGGLQILVSTLIVVAIAVPNFLAAKNRGQQKRTMSDMRTMATAVEAYAVDNNFYPDARSISELRPHLEPIYLRTVPSLDGWENEYRFESWTDDFGPPAFYRIGSSGRDGEWEYQDIRDYPHSEATTSFNADIIYENGIFIQWPQGVQGFD